MTKAFDGAPRVTQERLKQLLHYDPETGVWTRVSRVKGVKPNAPVGYVHPKSGHRTISVDGYTYRSSHLAFVYMTGKHPVDQVDHRDVDPGNDRWSNLRPACEGENRRNVRRYRNNSTGFKGVYAFKNRWRAQISSGYQSIHLGVFDTPEAAHAAYAAKAAELFGEFARHT